MSSLVGFVSSTVLNVFCVLNMLLFILVLRCMLRYRISFVGFVPLFDAYFFLLAQTYSIA